MKHSTARRVSILNAHVHGVKGTCSCSRTTAGRIVHDDRDTEDLCRGGLTTGESVLAAIAEDARKTTGDRDRVNSPKGDFPVTAAASSCITKVGEAGPLAALFVRPFLTVTE
jgi:hypothetical protein